MRTGDDWHLDRPVDLRNYITPGFDESYNLNHWWADRKREVLIILRDEYSDRLDDPNIQRRFDKYRAHPPSASKEIIDSYFLQRGEHPQISQSCTAFDSPPHGSTLTSAHRD